MENEEAGRIRTGTLWTGTAHALTAMVGSGILALPWCLAQMGWILGPLVIAAFAGVTYYTAILLSNCYRAPDPLHGRRNYTYADAVRAILGSRKVLICGILQYSLLWGTMIGFTITTATSIAILKRSTCFHMKGHNANCKVSGNLYMLIYGTMEIVLSQCPNLEKATFLSVVAAITSFAYALIALGLSTFKFFSHPESRGSLMISKNGENISSITKVWHVFQALGNIAFSYTYSILQLEIQDTLKPPENELMKKVSMCAIGGTTLFYISLACMAYAAFGNRVPGNVLAGFDNPFWLVDIANLAVIIHLIGAYQVFAQPIFAIHEKWLASRWPALFLNRIHTINICPRKNKCCSRTIHFTLSRLLLRTIFVVLTTIIAMIFPFFNAVLGLLGSISFWPLTVYFPLSMYVVQAKIRRGSSTWIIYQILGLVSFIITVICFVGSVADIADRLKHTKLFHIEP